MAGKINGGVRGRGEGVGGNTYRGDDSVRGKGEGARAGSGTGANCGNSAGAGFATRCSRNNIRKLDSTTDNSGRNDCLGKEVALGEDGWLALVGRIADFGLDGGGSTRASINGEGKNLVGACGLGRDGGGEGEGERAGTSSHLIDIQVGAGR